MNEILQISVVILNMLAFIATAFGKHRLGFFVMLLSQPLWWVLGASTGLVANQLLAVFYTVASIWGIIRENNEHHVRYGDFTEAILWFFKIGWEPLDNYGSWWNRRLKKSRNPNHIDG